MIHFKKLPMPHLNQDISPDRDAMLVFDPDASPSQDDLMETRTLTMFEVDFHMLPRRYRKHCFVYSGHGAYRVKDEPVVPTPEVVLLRKLRNLIDHPNTNTNERRNAQKRVTEIGVKIEGDPDVGFLTIDRTQLFLDNMDVQAGGLLGKWKVWGREILCVYADNKEEVEGWLEVAQYAADNYIKVPRRLCA